VGGKGKTTRSTVVNGKHSSRLACWAGGCSNMWKITKKVKKKESSGEVIKVSRTNNWAGFYSLADPKTVKSHPSSTDFSNVCPSAHSDSPGGQGGKIPAIMFGKD